MAQTHNTQEKIHPASFHDLRRIVVSVLLVALLVNVGAMLWFQKYDFNESTWLTRCKWRLLLQGPTYDWLIFGDSSGNQGVDAELFGTEMKGRAFNACLFRETLIQNDLDMLRSYLEKRGTPRGVVMVHTDELWWRTANPRVVAHVPLPWNRLPEYQVGVPSPWDFWTTYVEEKYVPLYSQYMSFWGFVTHPTKIMEPRRAVDKFGFQLVNERNDRALEQDLKRRVEFARKNRFTVSEINRRAMTKICRLAEQKGFDVYFSMCPIFDQALADPDFRANYDAVVDYLRSVAAASPHFHLLEPFPIAEPRERVERVDHVRGEAARDFTRLLA